MYQSTVINSFIQSTEESETSKAKRKESKIDSILTSLKEVPKFNWSGLIFINIVLLLMTTLLFFSVKEPTDKIPANFGFFMLFSLSIVSVVIATSFFNYSQKEFLYNLKQLFLELSDKPYEIRLSYEKDKKIKIIIEENLYSSNSHIIKEKSKHLTAYLDPEQSYDSIIKFIIELVKKSESLFK